MSMQDCCPNLRALRGAGGPKRGEGVQEDIWACEVGVW